MSQTKTLAELTIKNNFLFSAVMLDPENCRGLLELILGISIDRVIVSREPMSDLSSGIPQRPSGYLRQRQPEYPL